MKKSINNRIWQQQNINENYVAEITKKLNISDLLAKIISSRIENIEEVELFFLPKVKNHLPDPFHLIDMEKAIKRVIDAIKLKQKIYVFADYDVDGATSSALLKNVFRDLGIDVDIYVPDRIIEGYGPTISAMQKIKDQGAELIITVDCGSTAHEAVQHANTLNLDVIIIDHHISIEKVDGAIAFINPNRLDESSEYKYIAAVGVTFLFTVALISELKKTDYFLNKKIPNLIDYLDLVALGTVCDVMPIVKLNRAFVSTGLKIMQLKKNIGVNALCDCAKVNEKLNQYHLGFILGPRINAGGRVGKASAGAHILSTTCSKEAMELAIELEKYNNERKTIELLLLEEAKRIAQDQIDNSLLFIVGENWHQGVIGIIAGKLKDQFNKPVAVISLTNGIGKASCRSIKGVDFGKKIIEAQNKGLILSGGGHEMAGGFTATEDKLSELFQFFNELFAADLSTSNNNIIENYDLEVTTSALNQSLMEELEKLEPYGQGNREPIFKFSNLFVLKADIVGNKHIRMMLAPNKALYGSKALKAIAFNAVDTPMQSVIFSKTPHNLSVIGYLKSNFWQNKYQIQLYVKDIIF